MTEQEMLARIQELEEENAKLKGAKKYKVSLLDAFEGTYPWLRKAQGKPIDQLSAAIRGICFPSVMKPHKHTWRGGTYKTIYAYLLQTKDMTDEQKARYVEIAGKMLAILDEYEIITETEERQANQESKKPWDDWYETHYGGDRND